MGRKRNLLSVMVVTIVLVAMAGYAYAGEHPEHPAAKAAEHASTMKAPPITKEELAEAIQAYVEEDAMLKGGYFLVYDKEAAKPLALTLKKVHKDRLSSVGHGVYFACADFVTPTGKVYDLDIFMKGPDKNHLSVTEITVHKESGEARYTWYESEGIWKRKSLETGKSVLEHPATKEGSHMEGSKTK